MPAWPPNFEKFQEIILETFQAEIRPQPCFAVANAHFSEVHTKETCGKTCS